MKPEKNLYLLLLQFAAAFLVLCVLLNFNYPGGRLFAWRLLQPSPDVWLLFVPLALAAFLGRRPLFWIGLPLWLLFLVLRLFRIGDTAVPMYLNRPFNLYIDSRYLFDLYDLLKTTGGHGEFLLISTTAAVAGLGFVVVSWVAWQTAARALATVRLRLFFLAGSGLLLGAASFLGWSVVQPSTMVRLGQEIRSIPHQLARQQQVVGRIEKTARDRAAGPSSPKGLKNADVLLFMIESYGRIVFSRPEYRKEMKTTMARFTKTLDERGFKAVSSYLESPTYGGSSWLAHSTLEFGLRVENDLEDTALLRSALPPLASYFRRIGYRTVSVMPGTRFAFPEGAAFDYDQVYYARNFNYRGPSFGWSPMPDQFVLDWVHRKEFGGPRQPLFVRYILVSSHAAFNLQPSFIADWDTIGDGSIYNGQQQVYFPIYWPDLQNAGAAYLRALDYEFTTLADYLAKYVDADSLVIIMGDHQPNLQLTGEGEPWSVPVHVISRNPRFLEPFAKRGYTPGLLPDQPLPHAGMETFLPDFLQDFRE